MFSNTWSIKHITIHAYPVKISIICFTDNIDFLYKVATCLRVFFVAAVPFIGCALKPRVGSVISLVLIVVVLLLRLNWIVLIIVFSILDINELIYYMYLLHFYHLSLITNVM